jgi:hypothetical protein
MAIQEDLLHYVWQFQAFSQGKLYTTAGHALQVLQPGRHNRGAGPDFAEASLVLDGLRWAGAVECHVKSSDWRLHGHSEDVAYQRVILHVVWQHDEEVHVSDGTVLPVLELRGLVAPRLLSRYRYLTERLQPGPACINSLEDLPSLLVTAMQERALFDRLEEKAIAFENVYEEAGRDWEETAYRVLARAWGLPYNGAAFEKIATTIPLKAIKRAGKELGTVEALLFGQAGLLESGFDKTENPWKRPFVKRSTKKLGLDAEPIDNQTRAWQTEYKYQAGKWGLPPPLAQGLLATGRVRPAHQPALKLAQLAVLLHAAPPLFDSLCQSETVEDLVNILRVEASPYWHRRFQFGPEVNAGMPQVGRGFALSVIVNAVVPLLVAYGRQRQLPRYTHQALRLLEELPPEHNHLTKPFTSQGVSNQDASQSQGLIGLHKLYCMPGRCLQCQIGAHILKGEGKLQSEAVMTVSA